MFWLHCHVTSGEHMHFKWGVHSAYAVMELLMASYGEIVCQERFLFNTTVFYLRTGFVKLSYFVSGGSIAVSE